MGANKPLYMLIDDNAIDLKVHSRLLNVSQLTDNIVSFSTANDALEYLSENSDNPNNLPEIILLDIQMPEMNGFDFLEAYKQLPENTRAKSKIFMLSTTMFNEDIEKAEANNYVEKLLSKPLDAFKLKEFLEDIQ